MGIRLEGVEIKGIARIPLVPADQSFWTIRSPGYDPRTRRLRSGTSVRKGSASTVNGVDIVPTPPPTPDEMWLEAHLEWNRTVARELESTRTELDQTPKMLPFWTFMLPLLVVMTMLVWFCVATA